MTTVVFDRDNAPHTFQAVSSLFEDNSEFTTATTDKVPGEQQIVGLIAWFGGGTTRDFMETFRALWNRGARSFVLLAPELDDRDPLRPWNSLPHLEKGALQAIFTVCHKADSDTLVTALRDATAEPVKRAWVIPRLQMAVEGFHLYDKLLRPFGHNSKTDLSNQFLAPARLLVLDNPEFEPTDSAPIFKPGSSASAGTSVSTWSDHWVKFKTVIKDAAAPDFGSLGEELVATATPIGNWLSGKSGETTVVVGDTATRCSVDASDFDRLMALLTYCRAVSGAHPTSESGSGSAPDSVEPLPPGDLSKPFFRVLVVDDHAQAWRPVFEKLQDRLRARNDTGRDVAFEFSTDSETVRMSDAPGVAPLVSSRYDLVILDIMLGQKSDGTLRDGRHLLETLRGGTLSLPVLLWTTSRDDEITTKASQANGLLLKKTVEWEAFTETIAKWMFVGERAEKSLPNPFFNHIVRTPEYRTLACDFNEWCLRQLDSFHALDSTYFRYFTDHGGRHIVKLLELLEQVIAPFIGWQPKDGLRPVLPVEEKAREFEALALYVAIVCHELGMFPLKLETGVVEQFSSKSPKYLDGVRTLHSIRGMVLLDSTKNYWTDQIGFDLSERLKKLRHPDCPDVSLRDLVALLVGYHARLFRSLSATSFLTWEPGDRFTTLKARDEVLAAISEDEFRSVLTGLAVRFESAEPLRERVRRQCAVIRFTDAMDIGESRNPALFLLQQRGQEGLLDETCKSVRQKIAGHAQSNREYLKRQLCNTVDYRRHGLKAEFFADVPDLSLIQGVVECATKAGLVTQEECKPARDFLQQTQVLERLQTPWTLGPDVLANTEMIGTTTVLALLKPIDKWLVEAWRVLLGEEHETEEESRKTAAVRNHLLANEALAGPSVDLLTEKGRRMIASMTALAVAAEMLDEYAAIVETELTDDIKLGTFKWVGWDDKNLATVTLLGATPGKTLRPREDPA